jgi:hypothetical protein
VGSRPRGGIDGLFYALLLVQVFCFALAGPSLTWRPRRAR